MGDHIQYCVERSSWIRHAARHIVSTRWSGRCLRQRIPVHDNISTGCGGKWRSKCHDCYHNPACIFGAYLYYGRSFPYGLVFRSWSRFTWVAIFEQGKLDALYLLKLSWHRMIGRFEDLDSCICGCTHGYNFVLTCSYQYRLECCFRRCYFTYDQRPIYDLPARQ